MRKVAVCGTESGYNRHRRNGEKPCDRCYEAERAAQLIRKRKKGVGPRRVSGCGTNAGYQRHRYYGEEACERCLEASRVRNRQRTGYKAYQSPVCGTPGGYGAHIYRKERPCDECRIANTEHVRAKKGIQPRKPAQCGTVGGHHKHARLKEKPCDACREARNQNHREYYARNRERLRELAAAWYRTPTGQEQARRDVFKRRARYAAVECSLTLAEQEEMWRLYDGRCYVCRIRPANTRDHVIPVSKGGADTAANCRPMCKSCNCSKGAKDVLDWLAPKWRPVWSAPLVPNYEVSEHHRADLAHILERI